MSKHEYAVRLLERDEIEYAAVLTARAFRDQPTAAAISNDPVRRFRFLQRAFRVILPRYCPMIASAWQSDQLVGILGIHPPGTCTTSFRLLAEILPRSLGWGSARGVLTLRESARKRDERDLEEPHIHLEPLAVDPLAQSTGVGVALLDYVIPCADAAGVPLFGTGDEPANQHYFSRYGFEVLETFEIVGMPHLSMRRPVGGTRP